MRTGMQLILIGAIWASSVMVVQCPIQTAGAVKTAVECNCGKSNCSTCRPPRNSRCRKCPKCENDVCQLSAECICEERICFEVEQKLICIPKISLPWRKCEQPCCGDCASRCRNQCGKTKVVKILKPKVYECPTCQYTWKVFESELPAGTGDKKAAAENEPEQKTGIEQPGFEEKQLYEPDGSDVPAAPPTLRKSQ